MRPFDLLTFDCYGTLIDWEGGMRRSLAPLARRHGLGEGRSLDLDSLVRRYIQLELGIEQGGYRRYREVLALGVGALFKEHGARLSAAEARGFAESLTRWPPFPETRAVLKALRRAGYRTAVLSNIDDALLRASLERIGVEFDHLVTAQQVRSYKPAARHWQRALAVSRIPRKRILHVAASQLHDIVPANTLGFSCVWINRNRERPLPGARPDHSFRDLRPLVKLLAPPARGPRTA